MSRGSDELRYEFSKRKDFSFDKGDDDDDYDEEVADDYDSKEDNGDVSIYVAPTSVSCSDVLFLSSI